MGSLCTLKYLFPPWNSNSLIYILANHWVMNPFFGWSFASVTAHFKCIISSLPSFFFSPTNTKQAPDYFEPFRAFQTKIDWLGTEKLVLQRLKLWSQWRRHVIWNRHKEPALSMSIHCNYMKGLAFLKVMYNFCDCEYRRQGCSQFSQILTQRILRDFVPSVKAQNSCCEWLADQVLAQYLQHLVSQNPFFGFNYI